MGARMMDTNTFGGWLARRLVTGGYRSQRAFAKAIDMDPTYLSRIINGHVARPERETLERMAQRLGVPYEEIAREAGALPDLPAGVVPPPQLALPTPIDDPAADIDFSPQMVVRYVMAHGNPAFRAKLEALAERISPEAFERICLKIHHAWGSNGHLAVAVAEEFVDL